MTLTLPANALSAHENMPSSGTLPAIQWQTTPRGRRRRLLRSSMGAKRSKASGVGISRADQSRIFQAFERVTTANRVGGLGLGLYIGRQIAVAHGGSLSVESKPDQGSTFTLELPLEAPTSGVGISGATSRPPAS